MKYRTRCCDELLESNHRHDFVQCPCGKTFVDGGNEYRRCGFSGDAGPPISLDEDGNEIRERSQPTGRTDPG